MTNYHGRIIDAAWYGIPHVIEVSEKTGPIHPRHPELYGKPFFFNFDCTTYALEREEVALVLGPDYNPSDSLLEINATLEACTSGPGGANAYVLGGSYMGLSRGKNYSIIPVQYFKIGDKMHQQLGVRDSSKSDIDIFGRLLGLLTGS